MWDLDSKQDFVLIHHFRVPAVYTWGDGDLTKREAIRKCASVNFPDRRCEWYGFRIRAKFSRAVNRNRDLENVPKLIIDAFSESQIKRDQSQYTVALYPDDNLDCVRVIQTEGEYSDDEDATEVWIFGKR